MFPLSEGRLQSAHLISVIPSPGVRQRARRIGVIDFALDSELRSVLADELADKAELLTDPMEVDAGDYGLLLVSAKAVENPLWSKFISQAANEAGCQAYSALDYEEDTGRVRLRDLRPREFLESCRQNSAMYFRLRPIADLGFSAVALILLLPLFAVVALLILATMGRPVLFAQDRVGLNGRVFRMYKFRTMLESSFANDTATAENDERITRIGGFLRRSHIDELPQLWNIFTGDMSFIGPRPEQPRLAARYRSKIPEFDLRHTIMPGLTGWAQVCSGYAANDEETRQKLEYDLYYLYHRGLLLDLKVLLRTLLVLFDSHYVR